MDKTGYTNYAVYITRSLSVARMIARSFINDTGNDSTVTVSYGVISAHSDTIPSVYQTKGPYCCVVRYDQQPEPSYEIIFA